MRNKLIAVVAASVLPLGFAATASANPTANHEVTFKVADARSISVLVLGEPETPGVLDLGVAETSAENAIEVEDAVEVTFRATDAVSDSNKVDITIQLRETAESGFGPATDPGAGILLLALPQDTVGHVVTTDTGGFDNFKASAPSVRENENFLFSKLYKEGGFDDTKFNVDFRIDTGRTVATAPGTYNYVILYTLKDSPS